MKRINDVLGYSNLKVVQDSNYFSFSLDSIILANYSSIRLRDKNIIDFCTGNAVIPLILSRRCDKDIDCIEVQEKIYDLAKESIIINNLEDRIHLYLDDVKHFSKLQYNLSKYDLVICNPPYFKNLDNSTKNLSYEKAVARHEILLSLDELCHSANLVLKDNGNFCIVHRSDRLLDVIDSFRKNNIEPKRIKFIHENRNKESNLVYIEGQKAGKVGLVIERPLFLFDEDGNMSDEYSKLQLEVLK